MNFKPSALKHCVEESKWATPHRILFAKTWLLRYVGPATSPMKIPAALKAPNTSSGGNEKNKDRLSRLTRVPVLSLNHQAQQIFSRVQNAPTEEP